MADVSLWTAQENVRVIAHNAIDASVNLPWTDYLVTAAEARRNWWIGASFGYMNLAADRNTAETTYTNRLANAYILREQTIATTDKNHALIEANSSLDSSNAWAQSTNDYFTALSNPAKTFADAVAQADRDQAVETAKAERDYAYHQNSDLKTSQIAAASNKRKQSVRSIDQVWYGTESTQQANKFLDFAVAARDASLALVAADVALANGKSSAETNYRNEESLAYVQSETTWANIDAYYRQYEANSFASAASTMATNYPSPWASYEASDYTAQANQITTSSNANRTQTIATATAQSTLEITQANTDLTWKLANNTANGVYRASAAVADFARGAVQSESIAAMGSSGIYRSDLPSEAIPADLSDIYEVTAASNSRYSVNITMTTGSPSGGSYPQYYWGYFVQTGASILNPNGTPGGGYWAGGGLWLDSSSVSSAANVHLVDPTEQFEKEFWDVESEASAVGDEITVPSDRYGIASNEILVPGTTPKIVEEFLRTPSSEPEPTNDEGSNSDVAKLLERIWSATGEYWALYGAISRAEVADRPHVKFASSSLVLIDSLDDSAASQSETGTASDAPTSSHGLTAQVSDASSSMDIAVDVADEIDEQSDDWEKLSSSERELLRIRQLARDQSTSTPPAPVEVNAPIVLPDLKKLTAAQFSLAIVGATKTEVAGSSFGYLVDAYYVPLTLSNGDRYGLIFKHIKIFADEGSLGGDEYSFVGTVPGFLDPKTALQIRVTDAVNKSSANLLLNSLEFGLHLLPTGAAIDYAVQGKGKDAIISLAGDLSLGLGKVAKLGHLSINASRNIGRGAATIEAGIGIYRTAEGAILIADEKGGYGELAEGILRLVGVNVTVVKFAPVKGLLGHQEYKVVNQSLFGKVKSGLMDFYGKHGGGPIQYVDDAVIGGRNGMINTKTGEIFISKSLRDKYPDLVEGTILEELMHFHQLKQRGWFGRSLTEAENVLLENEVVRRLLRSGLQVFN